MLQNIEAALLMSQCYLEHWSQPLNVIIWHSITVTIILLYDNLLKYTSYLEFEMSIFNMTQFWIQDVHLEKLHDIDINILTFQWGIILDPTIRFLYEITFKVNYVAKIKDTLYYSSNLPMWFSIEVNHYVTLKCHNMTQY